jgi:hypothetical protein
VLQTWHLQGERVQPVALPAAFDAPNALMRDFGRICQGELSAHVRQALANNQVRTANRPRTWPIVQPSLVHVRLDLVREREAAVAERDQWKPAFVHTRSRCICGQSQHSLHRGKRLNAMLGEASSAT